MKHLLFEKLEIIIRDLTHTGEGIGTYQNFTIFVPGALPKETVLVKVKKVKKNYAIAKLLSIIKPSQARIDPKCQFFPKCGGCQIRHLDYQAQLAIKKNRIEQSFSRLGNLKIPEGFEVVSSPLKDHYRNKIQLPFSYFNNKLGVGLYSKGSHDLVEIDQCLIHNKLSEEYLPKILQIFQNFNFKPSGFDGDRACLKYLLVKTAMFSNEILITIVTNNEPTSILKEVAQKILEMAPEIKGIIHHKNDRNNNVILGSSVSVLAGSPKIYETLLGLRLGISAQSFFQVNPYQAENLYKLAKEYGMLSQQDIVIDAYSGIGSLTLHLAPSVQKIYGLEYVSDAVKDAKDNADLNNINNTEMIAGDVKNLLQEVPHADVIYLNPPRKGCDKQVLEQIIARSPETIVYISCDPSTLARDVAILCQSGYKLSNLKGFDMFPQTMHVETVAQLTI